MAAGKRDRKHTRAQPQLRSRTTRSSKGRLLADPETNTQELTAQLRALGLYAAPTMGDGNCLFRALADQLYGSPSHHAQLRADVCDWIAAHKARYEPFVEDERGLDVHLRCMRENGTYGGHMELSAFAHLMGRNVKVIQPGLVYVIEWAAGGDPAGDTAPAASTSTSSGAKPDSRADRHARRDRRRTVDKSPEEDDQQDGDAGTIYVAYHDWEHFSSIRSLRGPHTGLPNVREIPAPAEPVSPPPVEKPISKGRLGKEREEKAGTKLRIPAVKPAEEKQREKEKQAEKQSEAPLAHPPRPVSSLHPSLVALHMASSSTSSLSPSSASVSTSSSLPADHTHTRTTRSPKRAFTESDASSCASATSQRAKRTRNTPPPSHSVSASAPAPVPTTTRTSTRSTRSTTYTTTTTTTTTTTAFSSRLRTRTSTTALAPSPPPSSTPSSVSASASASPLSSALSSPRSSPSPPPEPAPAPRKTRAASEREKKEKPLTRRQRKALGLPKPHPHGAAAGKIVIPGGRYALRSAGASGEGDKDGGEWVRSGVGRVDVRGFRELRI